jgi:hypothetical protein
MGGRRRGQTVISLEARRAQAAKQKAAPPEAPHPLYGVALLKTALEVKRRPEDPVEQVLGEVLARMKLEQAPFLAWLREQGGLLEALARRGQGE